MKNKETKRSFCQNSAVTPFQQTLNYSLETTNFQGEEKMFDAMLVRLAETIIWHTILS
ncbi:MAG: hypothetical protein ABIH76_01775 [Candidatus Bathyarchaeota archaeon]